MELSGHSRRLRDYEAFAELGLRTLRTGVLWERHERLDSSWAWTDERLHCLRQLRIRPIASLLHHGSGPPHTSLLDPEFPEKLAAYAGAVAARYPWLDAYTPVNEPNTTARFSARYGLWYPHHAALPSYFRALLNQVKATVLSMEAIRRVRPEATLVQTDDGGRITGTAELRPIWELLQERQWLGFDLLCGRVDRLHPLFRCMLDAGLSEREVLWFAEHPCPPDVVGLNYYVTSDRFLDHRIERYPHQRSAEGAFADVEAVRAASAGIAGVDVVLQDAWKRYGLPVAVTEVHMGSSVDEQIRWFAEVWEAAQSARRKGVHCTAITAWALLGSYYWNDLVTRPNGYFEPGAFDRSGAGIAPNELAKVMAQLAAGEAPRHHALAQQGWWRHPNRMTVSLRAEDEMPPLRASIAA